MKRMKKLVSLLLVAALLMSLAPMSFATEAEPFRISCTMNGDAATARGFCWYTNTDTASVVELTTDGVTSTVEGSSAAWEGNFVHKVVADALQPGTAYSYRVGNGTVWSDEGTFVTDDGDDAFDFLVIADVQASSLENFEKAAVVVNKAYSMYPDSAFLVNCGDFTNDSTNEEWDFYDTAFRELNLATTLVPVSGNHDGLGVWHWFDNMFALDTSESVQTLNGVNYSFDYGNAHIAVLNTNDLLSITDAQLQWLTNDMNATACDWKLVFMHKSPYTLGKDGKWPDALYLQDSLAAVCDATGVDLVMSGHDHMYLRTKALRNNAPAEDGTVYVLSGTAGSKRYEIRTFLEDSFLPIDCVAACNVQKNGYGNYFNGTDFDSTREENIGGCFNSISVSGGTLALTSYIVSDETGEAFAADSFTLTKQTGQNSPSFDGDNSTSAFDYAASAPVSLFRLAFYALTKWLFTFLKIAPEIISVYKDTGTF